MQPLLITNTTTNASRDENQNKQKLLPVLPEYNIGCVNRTEHDNAVLYDRYIVRLQSSKFHLNKDANRIAYRNLAYYFLVYGNKSSINTGMTTASVNGGTANSNSISDDATTTVELNNYFVNYLNTDAVSMIQKSMEYCTSKCIGQYTSCGYLIIRFPTNEIIFEHIPIIYTILVCYS